MVFAQSESLILEGVHFLDGCFIFFQIQFTFGVKYEDKMKNEFVV